MTAYLTLLLLKVTTVHYRAVTKFKQPISSNITTIRIYFKSRLYKLHVAVNETGLSANTPYNKVIDFNYVRIILLYYHD